MKSLILDNRQNKRPRLDGPTCRALQQLRGVVEQDPMAPSVGCVREGNGGARGGRPLVTRLSYSHHTHLLTLADLLDGCPRVEPLRYQDTKENIISKHRAGEAFTMCRLLVGCSDQENTIELEKFTPTALHVACLLPQPGPLISKLVRSGVSVKEVNSFGQTPLHTVLLGDVRSSSLIEALEALIANGADVNARDNSGETPLHCVRNLLREGLYERAAEVAHTLLVAGAHIDAANNKGRTLLTYSVEYLDDALALTRTLVNHGSCVWGAADGRDKDQSVFAWFLKAVISHQRLENCSSTITIISQLMAADPRRMHQHILRTMFRQSRCYHILGPLFLELKTLMMPHWTQPASLSFLCWQTIRRSLTPKRIHSGTPQLGLPPPLQSYILLEEPGFCS
ncbi:ankyrin repeat and SOCS box protein 18 [Penaeus vannamei]|uniref:ankyrin repeat and SOCS box protein 18 n=1 Tax=Penaeus vannamei TaxID=6689 RepID=UPI00387FAC06